MVFGVCANAQKHAREKARIRSLDLFISFRLIVVIVSAPEEPPAVTDKNKKTIADWKRIPADKDKVRPFK
jgi:hypothetical protein